MNFRLSDIVYDCLLILLSPLYLLSGIINIGILLAWLYHRVLGQQWDQNARIATDLAHFDGGSVRVQPISVPGASQITLITFGGIIRMHLPPRVWLTIPWIPVLAAAHYGAVLSNVHLEEQLMGVAVAEGCSLNLGDLMNFVRRHPKLRSLTLRRNAVDPTSLTEIHIPGGPGTIMLLKAPALYIPSILPLEPQVRILNVCLGGRRDRTDHNFHRSTYARVIEAILALPAPAVETLTLRFAPGPIGFGLPWRTKQGDEGRLSSVTRLGLELLPGELHLGVADMQLLPRWLARFPALIRVEFHGGAVREAARTRLAEAIWTARGGGSAQWQGVHFA